MNGYDGYQTTNQGSLNVKSGENVKFDDLISALKAKDVFREDSTIRYMHRKKSRNTPPTRENSRDRVLNNTLQK